MSLRPLSNPAPDTGSTHDAENTLPPASVLTSSTSMTRVSSSASSASSASTSSSSSSITGTARARFSSTEKSTVTSTTASMSSTSALAVTTSASTNDPWGPAITASSFSVPSYTESTPVALPTRAAAVQTEGLDNLNSAGPRLSRSSQDALISTTVIGGTFVIVLLIWAIYRRRQGATYAQILHVRPREPPTPTLTPTPMREKFFTLPIYRDTRFSVRSTHDEAVRESSDNSKKATTVPAEVATRFHEQNAYIQNSWKTKTMPMAPPQPPPKTPEKDKTNRQTFLFDASPTVESIKIPEKAQVLVRSMSNISRLTRDSSAGTVRSDCRISNAEATAGDVLVTPPGSPISHRLLHDARDRWSWTNSQAPSTPRMVGRNSMRSSRSSLPHFRSVVSWVRGQSERERIIEDEEAPPLPNASVPPIPAAKPTLKNQASKPTLAPRKLSKSKKPSVSHEKGSSLGSLFRSSSRPQTSDEQKGAQPSIEMHDRSRSG